MKAAEVILVNVRDEQVGIMEKMEAHEKGLLHRAFSVFIFNRSGQMLLQQRAASKYHGAGLWTNACCSHPYPGERVEDAAMRRMQEELGMTTPLKEIFSFTYRAKVENGLIEHEFDHVFAGEYEGDLHPDAGEVAGCTFASMQELKERILRDPQEFTTWFCLAFPRVEEWWEKQYGTERLQQAAG